MNAVHEDLLRATTALQVATFEQINAGTPEERKHAHGAMQACLKRVSECVAALRRFKTAP